MNLKTKSTFKLHTHTHTTEETLLFVTLLVPKLPSHPLAHNFPPTPEGRSYISSMVSSGHMSMKLACLNSHKPVVVVALLPLTCHHPHLKIYHHSCRVCTSVYTIVNMQCGTLHFFLGNIYVSVCMCASVCTCGHKTMEVVIHTTSFKQITHSIFLLCNEYVHQSSLFN